jgi:hypothetical protein
VPVHEQLRGTRTVVIDRGLHLRLRTDMTIDIVRRSRGVLAAGVSAVALGFVLARPVAAVIVAVVAVVGWAVLRWLHLGRTMRHGLGVGQPITVRQRLDGDPAVVVTDVTGEVELGRGSVLLVTRFRSSVTVHGRQLSFVLPTGLLTESEIGFLEGDLVTPEASAEPASGPASALPLSLTVTEDVQQRAGAAIVRAVALSADALLPVVVSVAFLVLGAALRSGPWFTVGAVIAAVCALTTPRGALRARSMVRASYPVGRTMRAEVTPDSMTTELDAVVLSVRWEMYDARRVTSDAVLLRRKGPFLSPDVFSVYPRDLFDDASIETLAAALPRTF